MQKITVNDHYKLNASILKLLVQNKVFTVVDFLQEDIEKLATITKLTVPEVLQIRVDFFNKFSAPVIDGQMLYSKNIALKKVLSTGITSLDNLMNGGIPMGCLTEIYGLAGSGKTQLCLHLALNIAKNSDNNVLYIDTKGDFSSIKLQYILQKHNFTHKDMALLMSRIKIIHIWTMDDIIDLLTQLGNRNVVIENLSLILIDSLPCLMFQYLGEGSKTGLSMLNVFANHCKFVSKQFNIGIICVNIQTRWVDHQDIPEYEDENESTIKERHYRCLGRYWQHIPALVLLLESRQIDENVCELNISLTKSIFRKSGISCNVMLNK